MEAIELNRSLVFASGKRQSVIIFLLLLGAIASVAFGVSEAIRSPDIWGDVLPIAVFGLIIGWSFSARRNLFLFILLPVGLLINLLKVGQIGKEVLSLLSLSPGMAWEVWSAPIGALSSLRQFIEIVTEIVVVLGALLGGLGTWVFSVVSGDPVFDPAVVDLIFGFGFWLISMWAGWVAKGRGNALLALLPGGLLLCGAISYAWAIPGHIFVFLGISLLLTSLLNQQFTQSRWKVERIDHPGDIDMDVGIAATVVTVVLVVIAAISPSISYRQLVELFKGNEDAVSSAPSSVVDIGDGANGTQMLSAIFDANQLPGLPREHLIGSGPELSEEAVMSVRLLNPPVQPPEAPRYRFYWRGLTYDIYTGQGWTTSETNIRSYQPNQEISFEDLTRGYNLHQEIKFLGDRAELIHVSGELLHVDTDFSVAWRGGHEIFAATGGGSEYRATSMLTLVDESSLREAGGDYPEWVETHYLSPFDNTSARVSELALNLTETEPTPYDRALAIERYLRRFPYTLDVSAPPRGQDVVEYFLFDLQQGYCDYYATAMVVLARATGLPARLAVGYASGTYDETQGTFVVTEAEAHSWVEIYFPEIGWVNFEPTAGRAAIERHELELSGILIEDQPLSLKTIGSPNLIWVIGIIALVLVTGIVLRVSMNARRMREKLPAAVAIDIYFRLRIFSQRFPITIHPGDTPYEFSKRLATFLDSTADVKPIGTWLTTAASDVRRLVHLVVEEKFSLHTSGSEASREAIKTWRDLNPKLMFLWVWYLLRDQAERFRTS